jgi:hypothetical protein
MGRFVSRYQQSENAFALRIRGSQEKFHPQQQAIDLYVAVLLALAEAKMLKWYLLTSLKGANV